MQSPRQPSSTRVSSEAEVNKAILTSAVHKAEHFRIDLGSEAEFFAGDVLGAHDMRVRLLSNGATGRRYEFYCKTCVDAENERNGLPAETP